MIKLIDNKRIDLTDAEYEMYLNICKSYDDPPSVKGSDLFVGLFETNGDGVIVFLKPPTRATSYEVIFYLIMIMEHQHLRLMHKQVDDKLKEIDDKLKALEANNK